ncbi:MAG TPA: hypothetical protein VK603_24200 [Candidatus Saccharimonadales bacterium]|nr:hypothetical protein [Candidatus Saccharimonadales bacterium]
MNWRRIIRCVGIACIWIVAAEVVLSPAIYFGFLNALGPSTEYYEPSVIGATKQPDGHYVAYLGDRIYVTYSVVRRKINGECFVHVRRYGEEVDGPAAGKRRLLNFVDLQFRGENELRRPRWPLEGLVLGDDFDGEPLLAPGVDERAFDLFVVARYYCNFMDYILPRYLQGGTKPDETERVRLIVRRHRQ